MDFDSTSLDQILLHPWHMRIWTVQEAVYAQHCVIMCGRESLLWEEYTRAVKFLVFDNFIEQVGEQAHKSMVALDMRSVLRDYVQKASNEEANRNNRGENADDGDEDENDRKITFISSCLTDVNQLQARDAKDMIYGLHALHTSLGISLPPVDYRKTLAQVYEDAAVSMVAWSGTLDVLGDAARVHRDTSFPSWVPNWADPELKISTPKGSVAARTPLRSVARDVLSPLSGRLHVHGRIVGMVDAWTGQHSMTPVFPSRVEQCTEIVFSDQAASLSGDTDFLLLWMEKINFFRKLRELIATETCYTNGFDVEDVLCDLLEQASYSECDEIFSAWLDVLQHPTTQFDLSSGEALAESWKPDCVLDEQAWSHETAACAVVIASLIANAIKCKGRKFDDAPDVLEMMGRFSTNLDGKRLLRVKSVSGEDVAIGTAVSDVDVGDAVVILEGASWPVVLRRDGDAWTFLGPAFVTGVMDGEVGERGGREEEEGLQAFVLI